MEAIQPVEVCFKGSKDTIFRLCGIPERGSGSGLGGWGGLYKHSQGFHNGASILFGVKDFLFLESVHFAGVRHVLGRTDGRTQNPITTPFENMNASKHQSGD